MLGNSKFARVPNDAYFTERPASRALLPLLSRYQDFWECAAGDHAIARELKTHTAGKVATSDIADYGARHSFMLDFLAHPNFEPPGLHNYAIVTNPPYDDLAAAFIRVALKKPNCNVVWMLLRHEFDCAQSVADLTDHPKFFMKCPMRWRLKWATPAGPLPDSANPRHAYAWYGWNLAGRDVEGGARTRYLWRPPEAATLFPAETQPPQFPASAPPENAWWNRD